AWRLATPIQFGPMTRTAPACSSSARWRPRPSSPASAKPQASTIIAPAAIAAASDWVDAPAVAAALEVLYERVAELARVRRRADDRYTARVEQAREERG